MSFTDRELTCADCGTMFIFSANEQEFYAQKGFTNDPKRCLACRSARKTTRGDQRGPRQMYPAVCAECGNSTEVPFLPRQDRPVYCSSCFAGTAGRR